MNDRLLFFRGAPALHGTTTLGHGTDRRDLDVVAASLARPGGARYGQRLRDTRTPRMAAIAANRTAGIRTARKVAPQDSPDAMEWMRSALRAVGGPLPRGCAAERIPGDVAPGFWGIRVTGCVPKRAVR